MVDIVSASTRSKLMSGIRSKNTKIEVVLRKALFARGLRYRKNVQTLPGKPDIVVSKWKAVIFINGCFWHMHNCKLFKMPETRRDFWEEKIQGNRARDEKNKEKLLSLGWRIAIVWECALRGKNEQQKAEVADALLLWLSSGDQYLEIDGNSSLL
ncbi:very short patch repair endonuclease [Aminivibrio sp.]|uniref:very short patch repair endonuclease n=1 Tax=Aminivibrio sp. TaxID=1872489 RepID=UPI00345E0949